MSGSAEHRCSKIEEVKMAAATMKGPIVSDVLKKYFCFLDIYIQYVFAEQVKEFRCWRDRSQIY